MNYHFSMIVEERILCASVWYKELSTPHHNVKNIDKGIVFSGYGHVHCLYQMCAMTGKKQHEVGDYIEGFLTSQNRFVDREEGAKIALECGQVKELQFSDIDLYSEDLYRT